MEFFVSSRSYVCITTITRSLETHYDSLITMVITQSRDQEFRRADSPMGSPALRTRDWKPMPFSRRGWAAPESPPRERFPVSNKQDNHLNQNRSQGKCPTRERKSLSLHDLGLFTLRGKRERAGRSAAEEALRRRFVGWSVARTPPHQAQKLGYSLRPLSGE